MMARSQKDDRAATDLAGRILGRRYLLVCATRVDACGTVYSAVIREREAPVRVRVYSADLSQDAAWLERFRSDVDLRMRIRSRHVVPVYDYGQDEESGLFFVVSEPSARTTLASLLGTQGALAGSTCLQLSQQIVAALASSHDEGLVHGDITPAGLELPEGVDGVRFARLCDYRLGGTAIGSDGERRSLVSPQYASPEHESAAIEPRQDVYSFGALLYAMLCGRLPFDHPSADEIRRMHREETPVLPSEVPTRDPVDRRLEAIAMHCLARDPDARYPSAHAVANALALAAECPATERFPRDDRPIAPQNPAHGALAAAFERSFGACNARPWPDSVHEVNIDELLGSAAACLQEASSVRLEVRIGSIWHGGEALLEATDLSESLAFALFDQGVRRLELLRGLERTELHTLLEALHRAVTAPVGHSDAVTWLWSQDLPHVRLWTTDRLGVGFVPDCEVVASALRIGAGSTEAGTREVASVIPEPDDCERGALEGMLREHRQRDPIARYVQTLVSTFRSARDQSQARVVLQTFETVLCGVLDAGDLSAARRILEPLDKHRTDRDELAHPVRRLFALVSEPARIRQVLSIAARSEADSDEARQLLAVLGSAGAAGLLWNAPRAPEAQRDFVAQCLGTACEQDPDVLDRALREADPVSLDMLLGTCGRMSSRAVAAIAEPMLDDELADVRIAGMKALVACGTPGVVERLAWMAEDASVAVRLEALQLLGTAPDTLSASHFLKLLRSPLLAQRTDAELDELMHHLARIGGYEVSRVLRESVVRYSPQRAQEDEPGGALSGIARAFRIKQSHSECRPLLVHQALVDRLSSCLSSVRGGQAR